MLLAFCPGGVSSNVISKLSRGDLTLAVSLTAVTSVIAFIAVPPLTALAILHFMAEEAPEFSITELSLFTFMLTTVPVMTGVVLRQILPRLAQKVEGFLSTFAIVLWAVLLLGIFYGSREIIIEWMDDLGPSLIALPFALMVIGYFLARAMSVSRTQSKTVSIETSVQNSPLGIALAGVIVGGAGGALSDLALPSGLYSITMYLVTLPAIFVLRRIGQDENAASAQRA